MCHHIGREVQHSLLADTVNNHVENFFDMHKNSSLLSTGRALTSVLLVLSEKVPNVRRLGLRQYAGFQELRAASSKMLCVTNLTRVF